MSAELIVERAGPQAIVVDRGRFGYRHEGIAWCGPADALAHEVANVLLVNDGNAATLECMFGDMEVRFSDARAFALTGAPCEATLDGKPCGWWAKHVARAGSMLTLRVPKRGVFSYLAVSGGIAVPLALGSRTTDRVARIGGHEGRALRGGDRLALGIAAIPASGAFAVAPPEQRERVRVIPCGEIDRFDEASRTRFFAQPWRVGHESNRMGYRLHGEALRYDGEELGSHAVFPGVVQVPPSGEPIVLLADAQTTGGYPKAGVAIESDLRSIAQARPGDTIVFAPVDRAEAARASARRRAYLQALAVRALERSGR